MFLRSISIFSFFSLFHTATAGQNSQQLLLVITDDWNQYKAQATIYEGETGNWQKVGGSEPAVVGKKGLGWGIGIHSPENLPAGPQKVEGDMKSPAGMFAITSTFGRIEIETSLPYRKLKQSDECVDDGNSKFYNQIVDRSQVPAPDWSSSEKMFFEPLYFIGAVVAHNPKGVKAKGSCIFLHIRPASGLGTSGCTAFAEDTIQHYAKWFDANKNPRLVQLPRSAFETLKTAWQLPEF